MKRTVLYGAFLVGCLSLAACQQHKESKTSEPDLTGKVAETSQITDCEIKVGDVTFTKSINGADTCVAGQRDEYCARVLADERVSCPTIHCLCY